MGENRTNRVVIRGLPTATVLTLTAAATLSMGGTASAGASSGGESFDGVRAQVMAWLATHPAAAKKLASKGVTTQGVTADFGLGKAAIPVEAMPDTYPSSLTPVFDNLQMEATFAGPTSAPPEPCFLMADSPDTPITTSDPDDCIIPAIPEGDTYTVAPGSDATVPAGFLLPAEVTGSMTDAAAATCTFAPPVDGPAVASASTDGASTDGVTQPTDIPYCIGPTVQVPGIWNPIELDVTNSITGQPVKGATYILTGPDQSPPQSGLRASGATKAFKPVLPPLATATTDSNGHLRFSSVYLGGHYTVSQIKAPKGYLQDNSVHAFNTPVVTSLAQAGHAFTKSLTVTPKAPTLNNDASGGAFGATQVIHVLANDSTPVGSLKVTAVTKPANGTVHRRADGSIVYRPADGFTGTDHFTYTARNSLGATATATVTVIVHPAVQAQGDVLPMTGQRTGPLVDAGLTALAIGALLSAAGARRRRTS
ncbi:MAG TPA: Ig-like domain-containing protein [Mycobacteriales bacterium]|nr:Ig-like domain-containing protein [Mycobacteriales bacterium]